MIIEKLHGRRCRAIVLALALMAAGWVLYWAAGRPTSQAAPQYQWLEVKAQPLNHELGLVGRVEPHRAVMLTAPFDGNIQAIHVEAGQRVAAGQLLLQMDPEQLDMQLREALAAQLKARRAVAELHNWPAGLAVARSRRAVAMTRSAVVGTQRKLEESRALLARGIIARNEVDELQEQLESARLDLAAALDEQADTLEQGAGEFLKIAELELANATLRHEALKRLRDGSQLTAPYSGLIAPVAEKDSTAKGGADAGIVQAGSRVSQGQALFALSGMDPLNIVSRVSEMDINKLQPGQPVQVTGDALDGEFLEGRLERVSDLAVPESDVAAGAQFVVISSITSLTAQQRARIRIGMSVRVTVRTYRNERAMVVPAEAITREGETRTVLHRESMDQPPRVVAVTLGQSVADGVEAFGLEPGFVAISGE
jgi:multidrug efflux pump subunit AcrA (membrane-fusion protein)